MMDRGLYKMGGRLPVTTYYRTMSIDNKPTTVIIGPNGEPIKLPESLESLPKSDHFPSQRHRWNTNEEIASMLIAFDRHHDWLSKEVKIRPKSGSMLLYSRKKVRYRRDGYCWKKRKDGKTTREDHMKLKVQGMECIYGCYVHSAILPTFHRRCYWLLQNPDVVLVHYLNVPYPDDNKMLVTNSVALWGEKKEWTKEELVSQLKPMFFSEEEPDLNSELEISTTETVEAIVSQLLEKQRNARLTGMDCACPDSTCLDSKTCVHQVVKTESPSTSTTRSRGGRSSLLHHRHMAAENNNQYFDSEHGRGGGRYYPECSTYSQVSSTTDHGPGPSSGHSTPSGHNAHHPGHSPLVLSLSQLQGTGAGLVILNSNSGPTSTTSHHRDAASSGQRQLSASTPTPATPSPRADQVSAADITSASRGEVGSVSAAVNTLNNIHEFALDLHNGNYGDSGYGGLQPVTDTLLSGSESRKSDEESVKSDSDHVGGPLLDFKSAFTDLENKNDMSFLHETLDLSNDEIHRALGGSSEQSKASASHHPPTQPHQSQQQQQRHHLHSMDYVSIESSQSHAAASFDVNLDSFDILSDFPELSQYEGGHGGPGHVAAGSSHSSPHTNNALINNGHPGPMLSQAATNSNSHIGIGTTIKTRTLEYRENLVTITDYSPGWSYTDGEEKVLVTGPWYSQTSRYQILFDGNPVATTLVQSGVLRCFAPAVGKAGTSTLEVSCDDVVISRPENFTYKQSQSIKPMTLKDYSNEQYLRTILLKKLESLNICSIQDKDFFLEQPLELTDENFTEFEDHLVNVCQKLTTEERNTSCDTIETLPGNGTTLLHLSSWLGMCRLTCSLLHWAAESQGQRLCKEVDALAQDSEGFTPLMRACANGNKEIATILYHWNSTAAKIPNAANLSCVQLAKLSSCPELGTMLDKLEQQKRREQMSPAATSSVSLKSKQQSDNVIFVKPNRAPSLDRQLQASNNPSGLVIHSRNPSPLGSTATMRAALVGVRNLREGSPATCQKDEPPREVIRLRLRKQPSVDSGINLDSASVKNMHKDIKQLSKNNRSLSLPSAGFQRGFNMCFKENHESVQRLTEHERRMPETSVSPIVDVEGMSSDDEEENSVISHNGSKERGFLDKSKEDQRVLTLAEHFLAAIPDRIKFESGYNEDDDDSILFPDCCSSIGADCWSASEDLGVESMADDQSVDFEFNFEEACQSYRDVNTPTSSLSPASFSLESPRSSFHESPSPCLSFNFDRRSPPTTEELSEFLQASAKCEKDLSNLTLSDKEQRELYQAAQIIQKAYRSYKGRKKISPRARSSSSGAGLSDLESDQNKEAKAAIVIQNYYRRYKQYIYWKQMAKAATLIQNKYRLYCEHKRFKKSQQAATCIQNYYRNYKEHQNQTRKEKESTPSAGLKRTYSQRRQHQAARKIQQFMRQTHLNTITEIISPRLNAADRAGCYTCRKREAPDSGHGSGGRGGHGVPAKMSHGHSHAHPHGHYGHYYGWGHHAHTPHHTISGTVNKG